jgi:hypothetical protein
MNNQPFFQEIRQLIARDELPTALEKMQHLLGNDPKLTDTIHQSGRFYSIKREIMRGTVSHAEATLTQNQIRFGMLDLLSEIEADGRMPDLPSDLPLLNDRSVAADKAQWVRNLRRDLEKQEVVVGDDPRQLFQHFGWLVQHFLYYLVTPPGSKPNVVRLSYMTEAWHSSLRYLCYIQLSQVLQLPGGRQYPTISEFLTLREGEHLTFDYLSLLSVTTALLDKNTAFMPDIHDFVAKISDTQSQLYRTVLVLHDRRRQLLAGEITDEIELAPLLDEYLTALVFWLRNTAFLAKYRLVSIKDINLNYRMGATESHFRHLFGELHGYFSPGEAAYKASLVKGAFTYNQSVLLFRGSDVGASMRQLNTPGAYLSLSPLLVDQSVLVEIPKNTPELYYFTGQNRDSGTYHFAHNQNELHLPKHPRAAQSALHVAYQNDALPKMDDLYEHLELLFEPFKTAAP